MGHEKVPVQISEGKIDTYTLKRYFHPSIFFPCVYLIFRKTNMIKLTLKIHDICIFYASNKMVVKVYVFFSFLLFGFFYEI